MVKDIFKKPRNQSIFKKPVSPALGLRILNINVLWFIKNCKKACHAADNSRDSAIKRVILCTAHWSKFQKAILAAFDKDFVEKLEFPKIVQGIHSFFIRKLHEKLVIFMNYWGIFKPHFSIKANFFFSFAPTLAGLHIAFPCKGSLSISFKFVNFF